MGYQEKSAILKKLKCQFSLAGNLENLGSVCIIVLTGRELVCKSQGMARSLRVEYPGAYYQVMACFVAKAEVAGF